MDSALPSFIINEIFNAFINCLKIIFFKKKKKLRKYNRRTFLSSYTLKLRTTTVTHNLFFYFLLNIYLS